MSNLLESRFEVVKNADNLEAIVEEFRTLLSNMADGKISVSMAILADIEKMRKRYFAMVRELGLELGYVSHQEREMFKVEVRNKLGIESIAKIKDKKDMMAAIEGLHQFAGEFFNYTFNDERKPILPNGDGSSDTSE